jgi:hypothetical protein
MGAGLRPERVAPAQRSAPRERTACLHAAPETVLSDLGHVQPRKLTMVYRFVDADTERLHGLAADLVRVNPDVSLIAGQREIRAEGWARAFPLDSFGRASRSLGGDPREVSTQWHARVHRRAIGRRSIKHHSASYDRPSLPRPASPKIRV